MKKVISLFTIILMSFNLPAQLNMTQLGKLSYPASRGDLSDIWGYVDENGNEYACVGLQNGVSIVDVTNPTNPVEVFWTSGTNTIWRDLKTWGDYLYVTNEGGNGLMIIDLSPLPNNTNLTVTNYTGVNYPFTTAHNLYIDENGVCYIFGANYNNGGAIMLDVATNPGNPIELGVFDTYYLHDGMARGDTLWGGAINDGFLVAVDVSNKSNPTILATHNTPSNFTHNCWISDDGNTLFTTDEVSDGYIGAYDVSNLSNITEIDRVQSSPGQNVIPHNTHVKGNFIVTSYYRDGVVVHDATYPSNLIEVGNYDTSPLYSGDGFNGCWGVYPWLPSGNIIASDIEEGLYILGINYTQACYLEGTVTDINTSAPINNVQVEILTSNNISNTNLNGYYQTGILTAGTYNVVYSASGYKNDTAFNVVLQNGIMTTQNMQLQPLTPVTLTGQVLENNTLIPISNAQVLIENNQTSYTATTDNNGNFTVSGFYEGAYNITVGKWGYRTSCTNNVYLNGQSPYTVYLDKGYYDDFALDFNWTVSGNASTGIWERDAPLGTITTNNEQSNPNVDATGDCSNKAYITGNAGGGVGDDDVDGGITILKSPVFDLTSYQEPIINYYRWFFNGGGFGTPNDSLNIYIDNGSQKVLVKSITVNDNNLSTWVKEYFKVSDYITPTATMQFIVTASDYSPGHIVEGGLDVFEVTDNYPAGINSDNENLYELSIYPSPANSEIFIKTSNAVNYYFIYSIDGKLVKKGQLKNKKININDLNNGIYLLQVKSDKNYLTPIKFIKE
jgi:choice-of-anchor B domain-containing protein